MRKSVLGFIFYFIYLAQVWGGAPIAEYRFDECSWGGARVVKDSAGAKNGVAGGTANTTGGGNVCRAGYFNGSGYVTVSDDDIFSPHVGANGEMSISAWIKIASYPSIDKQGRTPIVAKGSGFGSYEYALYLYSDGSVDFTAWQLDGNSYVGPRGGFIDTNVWHNVVGTLKKGEYARVYIDGVLTAETSLVGAADTTANGSSPLYIARRGNTGNYYFKGFIDEVRIYDKALSVADIQAIHSEAGAKKNYDGSDRVCGALISSSNISIAEGNSGVTNAIFTVALDSAITSNVSVDFMTADITATAGTDYTPVSGTLTFTPSNQTPKQIIVPIMGDTIKENDETFKLVLSNPVCGVLAGNEFTATIIDDDISALSTFNCEESAVVGLLYTKISGIPFGFDVVALKADGSVDSSYAGFATVDIVEDTGGACGGAVIASQALSFGASDGGKKAIANTVINSAHKKLRCRVTDLTNPASPVVGCSSDTFAVRPAMFSGTVNGFLAGEQKSATPSNTIFAKSSDNTTNVSGYNAVLDKSSILGTTFYPEGLVCESDTVEKLIDNIAVSFADGVSSSIDAKFKDIGVFDLNLTDSTWTLGDECIAGNSSNIQVGGKYGCDIEGNVKASVGVYQMSVEPIGSIQEWRYKTSYLDEQNASYAGVVKAEAKGGSVLKNFSKSCFGENTNMAFSYSTNGSADIFHKAYAAGALIDDKNSSSSPVSFVIPKSGFEAGSASFNIDFGAHRDFSVISNPTKLIALDFNTTNSAPTQLGYKFDSNASTHFLYGKIYMPDYIIDYNGATQIVRAFAQFYDDSSIGFANEKNMSKALGSDKWWINRLHSNEGNISNILVKTGDKLDGMTNSANFSISPTPPYTLVSGIAPVGIDMSAAQNIDQKIKLHLEVPKYLWHGSKVHSFASGSDYSEHPSASIDIFGSNENAWIGNSDKTIKSTPKGKRNMKINW